MAQNSNKKTKFVKSKSVVTDDFLNSIYGGLKGTEMESVLGTTDPLIGGHVHDGVSADGHAQKINLSKHVTGKLPTSMIAGSFGKPSAPIRSIQFNSADSFGGSPAFSYYSSTDSLQLSKDYKFYYGSVDSTTSFYMQNTVAGTTSFMNFVSKNTIDMVFKFGTIKNSTDLIYYYDGGDSSLYSNNDESNLGIATSSKFYIWDKLYAKDLVLYNSSATHFMDNYFAISARDQAEQLIIEFPKYRPTGNEKVMKVVSSPGVRADLTWDTFHSPGAPINGFQFNSADTFGGAETFYFEPSTRDVVFAKDHKWWFGSTDSSNSFWIEHEIDGSTPVLEFYAANSVDSSFVFTNGISGTTDVYVKLKNNQSYFYTTGTGYLGDDSSGDLYKWRRVITDGVRLYHNDTTADTHITLNANGNEENYNLELPKFKPTTVDMFMKVVQYGSTTELTWDTNSSTIDALFIRAPLATIDLVRSFEIITHSLSGNTVDFNFGSLDTLSVNSTLDAGALTISGAYTLPTIDGSADYILKTNGSGTVVWTVDSSGISELSQDISPELGGDLNANGNDIVMGSNTITDTKVGQWDTAYGWGDHSLQGYLTTDTTINAGLGLNKVGNTIDLNQNQNLNTVDINFLTINSSYSLPSVDGSADYILKTNGSGVVSWTVDSSGTFELVQDTTPELGGQLVTGSNKVSFSSGNNTSELNFQHTWGQAGTPPGTEINHTYIATVKSFDLYLDMNGGDGGQAFRVYNNINPSSVSVLPTDNNYIWKLNEDGIVYMTNNLLLGSTDNITIGSETVTSTKITQWDTAYGWGDHSLQGYLTTDTTVSAGLGLNKTGNTINLNQNLNLNTADINSLSINGNYTFPTVDGSADYILKTNGSGTVVWTVDKEAQHWQTNSTGDIYYASGNMGVGISNPDVRFHMSGDGPNTSQIRLDQYSGTSVSSAYDGPDVAFYSARGTEASPQVRVAGDYVGAFNMRYYNGSSYEPAGFFGWQVGDTPSNGSSWFNIKTNVGGTNRVRIKVEKSGAITFGNAADGTNFTFPLVDGTAGYMLATDGSGQLSWVESESLSSGNNIVITGDGTVDTASDILINTLDCNFAEINEISIGGNYALPTVDGSADYILKTNGSGVVSWTVDSGGISNVIEDTSPQLGGNLDLNSRSITGLGTVNITGNILGSSLTASDDLIAQSGIQERFSIISSATGVTTHDTSNGHIFFHQSISSNFTANFTNVSLASGYSTGFTLVLDQGSSGYIPSAVQINSVSQTINWQGGSPPIPTTNNLDVVNFSILYNGSGYIVLGQLVSF